eukprot:63631-Rhodomonas_salina.1
MSRESAQQQRGRRTGGALGHAVACVVPHKPARRTPLICQPYMSALYVSLISQSCMPAVYVMSALYVSHIGLTYRADFCG